MSKAASTTTKVAQNVKAGPQAKADAASGGENQVITIDVMANDAGGNGKALWSLDQANPGVYTAPDVAMILASGATVRFEGGKVVYDPGQAFDHLNEGEVGADSFTYAIRMGNGVVSYATVSVTLNGESDGPVDENLVGTEGDDTILGNGGQDYISGLGGRDYIDFAYGGAEGGDGNDTIVSSGPAGGFFTRASLDGGDGDDVLTLEGGTGFIVFGEVYGGNGDDVINFGGVGDLSPRLAPGSGADTINLSATAATGSAYVQFGPGEFGAGDVIQGVGSASDYLDIRTEGDGNLTVAGSTWTFNGAAVSVAGIDRLGLYTDQEGDFSLNSSFDFSAATGLTSIEVRGGGGVDHFVAPTSGEVATFFMIADTNGDSFVGGGGFDVLSIQPGSASPQSLQINGPGGGLAGGVQVVGADRTDVLISTSGGGVMAAGDLTGVVAVTSYAYTGSPTVVDFGAVTGSATLDYRLGNYEAFFSAQATVIGTPNGDVIQPGRGDDMVTGGAGDDLIYLSERGYFRGDYGSDTVVVGPGSGHDQLHGFRPGAGPGHDVIDLSAYGFSSLAQVLNAAAGDDSYGIRIQLDGANSITVADISLNEFTADNFVFI
ncbi:Ig-like domain-containing protein [Phenylobacterium ferrooxidans]|uniref:Uncharacterized protein n=1 Tax=Phenylobacterium ferrooxidans TaxID=2982689 RepID=A0ABW6CRC6_9CAUL